MLRVRVKSYRHLCLQEGMLVSAANSSSPQLNDTKVTVDKERRDDPR